MKIYLLIAALIFCSSHLKAQTQTRVTTSHADSSKLSIPLITYMMPDGTFISKDKIDSVDKSWNGASMIVQEEKDKSKGVFHLIKLTDAEMKQITDKNAKDELIIKAMVNKPAVDFSLKDLQGKKWSLAALRGKVVVLNFWYTSCPPCLEEIPQLNEITKMYTQDKVVFLALTFNDAPRVEGFLKTHDFSYVILPGSKAIDQQYSVSGWPTSLVINKKGIITFAANISTDIKHDLASAINADL